MLVFWAAGEACRTGGITFDINISVDSHAGSALPHTPIAQSEDGVPETATFANGWLAKMIKDRLHLQQSDPD